QFILEDPAPLLYHNEPIVRNQEIVGYLSSGSYGHHLGASIGMGYVPVKEETAKDLLSSDYDIEVAGTRFKAKASIKPLFDPSHSRMKM
ncbi:MAG: FAD-dependent oxidoreductase, partial [Paracoccaceae bacterium]|nr:FAD-dependent oxidoreductase [Paracoccaceae bacterium]